MTPLAKKVFELFGKPELAAETESKSAEKQPAIPDTSEKVLPEELKQ